MAKLWREVSQDPTFQALPAEEQEAARAQYFEEVVAPQIPTSEIEAVRSQFDSDTGPSAYKTAGTAAKDLAVSFGAGANSLLEMGGTLSGLVSGDMDNWARRQGESGRDFYQELKSPGLRAKEQAKQEAIDKKDGEIAKFVTALKETASDPVLFSNFLAEQIPNLVGAGIGGRVIGGTAKALGAGAKTTAAAATTGAVGTGAALQGADSGGDAYDRLKDQPDALVQANDAYKKLIDDGVPADQAREQITLELSRLSAIKSAAVSAGVNLIIPGARSVERVLGGGAKAGPGGFAGAVKGGARGFVGEGIAESTDEGAGRYFANAAVKEVDPNQSLTEGVGQALAEGALFAPFGGVAGAVEGGSVAGPVAGRPTDDEPTPGVAPGDTPAEEVLGRVDPETQPPFDPSAPIPPYDPSTLPKVDLPQGDLGYVEPTVAPEPPPGPMGRAASIAAATGLTAAVTPPVTAVPGTPAAAGLGQAEAAVAQTAQDVPRGAESPPVAEQITTAAQPGLITPEAQQFPQNANIGTPGASEAVVQPPARPGEPPAQSGTDAALDALLAQEGTVPAASYVRARKGPDGKYGLQHIGGTEILPSERFRSAQEAMGFLEVLRQRNAGRAQGQPIQPQQPPVQPQAQGNARNQVNPAKDDLITAIGKIGGLDAAEAERQGLDPAIWKTRGGAPSGVFGQPWIRKSGGMSFDAMAEALNQYGFFPPGTPYSPNALLDMLGRQLGGDRVFAPTGAEAALEQQAEQRDIDEAARALDEQERAELEQVLAEADSALDDETIAQINEDLAVQAATEREYYSGIEETFDEAVDNAGDSQTPSPEIAGEQESDNQRGEQGTRQEAGQTGTAREQATEAVTGPPDDAATPAKAPSKEGVSASGVERYQWMRNAEGGQISGNRQIIQPITENLYTRWVKGRTKGEPTFAEHQKKYPGVTHISLIERADGNVIPGAPFVGTLESLRPKVEAISKGWAKKVSDLESQEAITHGKTADSDVPAAAIDESAHAAATSKKNDLPQPTEAQKEAGNYTKGHITLHGLDISIENPAGSRRRPEWPPLAHHYGYIKGTVGKDKDHIDVFLGKKAGNPFMPVFVVDQTNKDGKFDEHKVMLGFENEKAAREGYLANYTPGWNGLGAIKKLQLPEFKAWLGKGDTTKPVALQAKEQSDLFGAIPTKEQALADAKRKVDERLSGEPVPVGEGKGDLFTGASKQMDIADAQPATAAETAQPAPHFETFNDAQQWINQKSIEHGGKKKFSSTPEYKAVYDQVQALYVSQKNQSDKEAMQALADAGLSVGDSVSATVTGSFLTQDTLAGTITERNGRPYVKLDGGEIPVSRGGKISYQKSVAWDRRWKKVAQEENAAQPAEQRPVTPQVERPAPSPEVTAITSAVEKMASVVDKLAEKVDAIGKPSGMVDAHEELFDRLRDGDVTANEYKSAFEALVTNEDAIRAELLALTKAKLLERFPGVAPRYRNEKKSEIADAAFDDMVSDYALGESISYTYGAGSYLGAVRSMVNKATDASLAEYAARRKKATEERAAEREKVLAGMENPETLEDYQRIMGAKARELEENGVQQASYNDVRMMLTLEQRVKLDELAADKARSERVARKQSRQDEFIRAPGEKVGTTEIIKTKHTKLGHDLWQFNLEQRVSGEEFRSLAEQARTLGGNYSSYRGGGAIPGWQFRTEEAAKAFKALVAGDTTQAKEVAQTRRDAFADDRSQTAVERLNEMADSLEAKADASLNQERKANTARRAGFAASAEASANSDIALAKTMRNIASAIQAGKAKYLDRIRQKVQVEKLSGFVHSAQTDMLRKQYPSWADYEKHMHDKPTLEAADYVTFPSYTAFRSDLASLGRALLDSEGTKKIGQRIMKVADDVSATYLKFAKDNIDKVSAFRTKGGERAVFASRPDAETAIARSGYKGTAIVLPFKRGENIIILSPSEAVKRGIWDGDGDKRITLSSDFGAELVERIGKAARRGASITVPWQFENTYDSRKRLAGMGIETPAELRAAVREFIGLREAAEQPSKVKQLERAMIGRKKDGLDFFPTPASVVNEMIEAADIQEGMRVLEPSAGMGHIADALREAGIEPDVIELSGDRRELLEAKGYTVVGNDFMAVTDGGYDRILMNPPFSDRRDAEHVQHAYDLLKPGGRLVAIMGEGVFFGNDKKAQALRDWLEQVGGTDEKLEAGSFLDPSLPVNTGTNARLVVITKEAGQETALFSRPGTGPRSQAIPKAAGKTIHTFVNDIPIKAHADYKAAKAGDFEAAVRLVRDLVKPANLEAARKQLGADVVFVPAVAMEASGINQIPTVLAEYYAAETGGTASVGDVIQTSKAYHTGAGPMERLIARPAFGGTVEAGKKYVLVDDVTTMGGTLAEMAHHIQSGGGEISGIVTLVNAGRSDTMTADKQQINEIERRYGDEIRQLFGIEPAALTRDEATYILGFRDADGLRNRAASAKKQRSERLRARGLQEKVDSEFAQEVLSELASVDEFFRFPVSESSSLEQVMSDVFPEATYSGEDTRADERAESGADRRFVFKTKPGKTFYVFERGNEVWIDVSRMEEGERGSAVYAAVGNYAHNASKRFVGDPNGLSEAAIVRRTSNMLSLALRFGTARFMEASPEQVKGDPAKGIVPLAWRGDDVAKTRALIDTFISTLHSQFPRIKNARYDFQKRQFIGRDGLPIDRAAFQRIADKGVGREARAGEATARRGIFIQSLVSSESGQRPGILEQVLSRGRSLVNQGGLQGLFSRDKAPERGFSISDATARQAVVSAFGEKATSVLEREGLLNFVSSPWGFPAEIHPLMNGTEEAVYWKGRSWIVKSASPSDIVTRVLHEIGEHHGLKAMLGDTSYAQLQKRIALMNRMGNVAVRGAWKAVVKAEPGLKEGSEKFIAEVIARVGQDQRIQNLTWWRQLLDAIRAFIIKHYNIPVGKVTAEHVQTLLRSSVMAAAREQGQPSFIPATGERALYSAKGEAQTDTADPENPLRQTRKATMEQDSSIFDHLLGGKFLFKAVGKLGQKTGAINLMHSAYDAVLQKAGEIMPESVKSAGEVVRAGIVANYGLDEAYLDRKADMRTAEAVLARKAHGMIEMLADLTRAESRVAYYWMQEKPDAAIEKDLMAKLPEASRDTLKAMKQLISNLSDEAVSLGQLSPEARERNAMAYLHRTYAKHVLAEEGVVRRMLRSRSLRVKGDQYKGRGLFEEVEMDQIQNIAPGFWKRKTQAGKADVSLKGEKFIRFERRDASTTAMEPLPGFQAKPMGKLREVAYWPAGEPVPAKFGNMVDAGTWEVRGTRGGRLVMWRDLTKTERERLGELDEVRYAVAQTLQMMVHDIEVGKFFTWMATRYGNVVMERGGREVSANEGMRHAYGKDTWVRVPDSTIPGTQVKKYGALGGMYIPGPIWSDIRQIASARYEPLGKTYATALRFWKKSKTAWSPGVHMNNVMANFILADWHDIRSIDLYDALNVWSKKSRPLYKEIFQRFEDSGALGGMFVSHELMRDQIAVRLEEMKADINAGEDQETSNMAKVLQLVSLATAKPAKAYTKVAEAAYQGEDEFFRLAVFLKAIRYGKSDRAAGKLAREAFLDYEINAPWVQMVRHTGLPFISFFYRAFPMLLKAIRHKPWKVVKLMSFWSLLSALGYAMTGDDDEERQRKLMAEEKAGRVWGLVPKMIRMPWNTGDDPVFLDIRRWIPVGDIADLEMSHGWVPPPLIPGGPMVMLAEVMPFVNKSIFTQNEIYKDTDTLGEASAKVADHLFKGIMPNVPVPNPIGWATDNEQGQMQTYAWSGIEKAFSRKENAVGEVRTPAQAMLNTIGVKIGSYPVNNMTAAAQFGLKRNINSIDEDIHRINRNYSRLDKPTDADRKERDQAIAKQIAKKREQIEKTKERLGR